MEARVERTLLEAGIAGAEAETVGRAHRLAMEPRLRALKDDHHPGFLHPGRTVLILLLDTPFRDPVGLAAAALVDSERRELEAPPERIAAEVGGEVAGVVASVPRPGPAVAEALITATEGVRLVALAERLDQCRHAKFWGEAADRRRILEEAEATYGPIAERTDPVLARRYRHWASAFGRSLAGP